MRGLYAIVDVDLLEARGVEPIEHARRIARSRPAGMQLRAKSSGSRSTLRLLRALAERCQQWGVPLFANDRPDLALLAGCDGVHVGQEDLGVADVRASAPGLRVGVSTHDARQLQAALGNRPDYVALGPLFPTRSKQDAEPVVDAQMLREASARCREAKVPLVGIGGIDAARAAELAPWVDAVAVISALLPRPGEGSVEEAADALAAPWR